MAMIIGAMLATACILFVVSLPISGTGLGQTLRRWSFSFFLCVLAPTVFVNACRRVAGPGVETPAGVGGVRVLAGLVLLSALAYAILKVRSLLFKPQRDAWSEYVGQRSAGKRVIDDRDADDRKPPPDDIPLNF